MKTNEQCEEQDRRDAIEYAKRVAEQEKAKAAARLVALRDLTAEKREKKEREEQVRLERQRIELKKREETERNRKLDAIGLGDLIPFYVDNQIRDGSTWWRFSVPDHCFIYVCSIKPANQPEHSMKFRDTVGNWSNTYYDLGELLVDAKL